MLAVQSGVEDELGVRDRISLSKSANDPYVYQMAIRRVADQKSTRLSALYEVQEAGDTLSFEEDSMASTWEFFNF